MFLIVVTCFFIIGVFVTIFVAPAYMNLGLICISNKDMNIEKSNVPVCFIPIYNHFFGNKVYRGNYISLSGISSIVLLVAIVLRYISMYLLFDNSLFLTMSVYIFVIAVIMHWLFNSIDVYRVLNDSGLYGLPIKIILSLLFMVGQIFIGHFLPNAVRYYNKFSKGDIYGRNS